MLSSIVIHLLAGAVAGSTFAVRTLIILVAVSGFGCLALLVLRGMDAALVGVAGLVFLQIGYAAGIVGRALLEAWGVARPVARTPRTS